MDPIPQELSEAATVSSSPGVTSQAQAKPKSWEDRVVPWSFAVGLFIFVLNMTVAWWVVASAKGFISQPLLSDKRGTSSLGQKLDPTLYHQANDLILLARFSEMEVHL